MKEWKKYVTQHSDIGIFTIAYMHDQGPCFYNYYVKVLLWLVPVVQLIVPICILIIKSNEYNETYDNRFCPNSADATTRILAWAVGAIYFSKVSLLSMKKIVETDNSPDLNAGSLLIYVKMDRFMNRTYESLVYFLNLWIVFTETDGFTIILNALALEFILELDDEVKSIYMHTFPPDRRVLNAYRRVNKCRHFTARTCCLLDYVNYSTGCVLYVWIVLLFFGLFYLPICKPGGPDDA